MNTEPKNQPGLISSPVGKRQILFQIWHCSSNKQKLDNTSNLAGQICRILTIYAIIIVQTYQIQIENQLTSCHSIARFLYLFSIKHTQHKTDVEVSILNMLNAFQLKCYNSNILVTSYRTKECSQCCVNSDNHLSKYWYIGFLLS